MCTSECVYGVCKEVFKLMWGVCLWVCKGGTGGKWKE